VLSTRELGAPALPEVRFLVRAVEAHPWTPAAGPGWTSPLAVWSERTGWVLELFADLERRERQRALVPPARLPRSPAGR
jgi:hypothetical protein